MISMNSRCCSVFPTPPAAPRLILRLPTLGSEMTLLDTSVNRSFAMT
jgi:hypothetical protein